MRSARVFFCLLFVAGFLLFASPQSILAQTTSTYSNTTSSTTNSFNSPNVDADVPQNQHTFAQSVTIEVMSALICQLSGIDPIDPYQGCLGVNPETRKLSMIKPQLDEDGYPEVGGMIGLTTDLIAMTYQQPATTDIYTEYLANNFGIVKQAHAQESSYGFNGLRPVLKLWEAVRNIAYVLLTLAFVLIGIGIMLRVKIDPRTVMTIQNQIPKVIASIIMITFSYAIAALMIDLMWVTTYAGVNLLSDHFPKQGETLSVKANKNILSNPITFTNQVFESPKPGLFHITQDVSNNAGELLRNIVEDLLGVKKSESCNPGSILPGGKKFSIKACLASVVAWLASVTFKLVILIILMVTLFRLWFQLLKAYIFTIVYVIVGPVYIVFGLLPSKPLGFEKWLRALFVNVATFPVTAFVIVAARLLMDAYDTGEKLFVPPLVGNPSALNFGTLLAFGTLLIAPSLNTILKEKMGVKGIGSPGLVGAAIAGGAAVVGGPASRAMKHLNRRDSRNQAVGALAVGRDKVSDWGLRRAAGSKLNPFKPATERKLAQHRFKRSGEYASGHTTEAEWKRENKPKDYRAKNKERRTEMESRKKTLKDMKKSGSSWLERREQKKEWKKDDKEGLKEGLPTRTPQGGADARKPEPSPGTIHVEAANVTINAGNIQGLNPEMGEHLNKNTGHTQHVQEEFTRRSQGKPFEGMKVEELTALPKDDFRRLSAENVLHEILGDIKKNPPKE